MALSDVELYGHSWQCDNHDKDVRCKNIARWVRVSFNKILSEVKPKGVVITEEEFDGVKFCDRHVGAFALHSIEDNPNQ
jgi:hypothetical protein